LDVDDSATLTVTDKGALGLAMVSPSIVVLRHSGLDLRPLRRATGGAHGLAVRADRVRVEPYRGTERRTRRRRRDRLVTLAVLVAVWAAGCAVLLVVVLQRAVPIRDLMVDPVTVTGSAWYAGFVTSIGVVGWTVASVACFGTAYAARLAGRPGAHRTFRGGALLFAVLLVDDLFLLHSDPLPELLGTTKLNVLAALVVLSVLWVVPSLGELRRTRWELFVASTCAFALSLAVDVTVPGSEAGVRLLVEDGAKFLGILALAAWSVMSARDVIGSMVASADQRRRDHQRVGRTAASDGPVRVPGR
jgi:hypothetical protein